MITAVADGWQGEPMPLTNPWLAGPTPERVLPRTLLEDRILNLLSTHNVAVIATVNKDGSPAATPVRFYNLGFDIFYTSWNASVKSRNLQRDPRVSAGAKPSPETMPWSMTTRLPYPPPSPAMMMVPSAAARIGEPHGAA